MTAISMVKIPDQKKVKLDNRDAEKFWPETYTADRVDKKNFAEFLEEVETYLSVLAPGLLARPLLEWAAAFRDQPIVMSDVEAHEAAHGNPFDWNLKETTPAQSVQRQRRSQAEGSGEHWCVQRLVGVGVLVPGQIHERFHVAALHDHEP